jgi:2-oxoglutarate ferredoxin oxidoreductase subunit alpha
MDDPEKIPDFVLERFYISRLPDKIEMVRDNQSIPGEPGDMRRVTGLNTDRQGRISYFAGTNQKAHEIRNEKVHHVQRALKKPEMFGDDRGDLLVVGWGSAKGAVDEGVNLCRPEGYRVSGLHLKIVYPLPLMLKDIFSRFKRVVTVEAAYGDDLKPAPLAMLLRAHTLVDVRSAIAKATGRPLTPKGVAAKIRELLK